MSSNFAKLVQQQRLRSNSTAEDDLAPPRMRSMADLSSLKREGGGGGKAPIPVQREQEKIGFRTPQPGRIEAADRTMVLPRFSREQEKDKTVGFRPAKDKAAKDRTPVVPRVEAVSSSSREPMGDKNATIAFAPRERLPIGANARRGGHRRTLSANSGEKIAALSPDDRASQTLDEDASKSRLHEHIRNVSTSFKNFFSSSNGEPTVSSSPNTLAVIPELDPNKKGSKIVNKIVTRVRAQTRERGVPPQILTSHISADSDDPVFESMLERRDSVVFHEDDIIVDDGEGEPKKKKDSRKRVTSPNTIGTLDALEKSFASVLSVYESSVEPSLELQAMSVELEEVVASVQRQLQEMNDMGVRLAGDPKIDAYEDLLEELIDGLAKSEMSFSFCKRDLDRLSKSLSEMEKLTASNFRSSSYSSYLLYGAFLACGALAAFFL